MSKALSDLRCRPCEGGVEPLSLDDVKRELEKVPGWNLSEAGVIKRHFTFKNFDEVMVFVNAIANIASREGHHPDVHFGYNYCDVSYTTHAIKGLSENDFICAAKVNHCLVEGSASI
jgi:4a-hydroxytetrahydrobiopterin dehydratase